MRKQTAAQDATITATMTRTDYLLQESKDTQDSLALYDAMRDELGVRTLFGQRSRGRSLAGGAWMATGIRLTG